MEFSLLFDWLRPIPLWFVRLYRFDRHVKIGLGIWIRLGKTCIICTSAGVSVGKVVLVQLNIFLTMVWLLSFDFKNFGLSTFLLAGDKC